MEEETSTWISIPGGRGRGCAQSPKTGVWIFIKCTLPENADHCSSYFA